MLADDTYAGGVIRCHEWVHEQRGIRVRIYMSEVVSAATANKVATFRGLGQALGITVAPAIRRVALICM